MKKIIITVLTFIFLIFGSLATMAGNWPTLDIWVYVKHKDLDYKHQPCRVIVHIPKNTLECDDKNCPAQDTKVVGEGMWSDGVSAGWHVVKIKKGALNNPKSYTFDKPKWKPRIEPDNITMWLVNNENMSTPMD